jgi:hypothetical protein
LAVRARYRLDQRLIAALGADFKPPFRKCLGCIAAGKLAGFQSGKVRATPSKGRLCSAQPLIDRAAAANDP